MLQRGVLTEILWQEIFLKGEFKEENFTTENESAKKGVHEMKALERQYVDCISF